MAKLHLSWTRAVRRDIVLAAATVVLGLAAASPALAQQQDLPPGYATQPFTPKNFQMPEGQGCAGDVARWRAVQDNDYASGNIGVKVYNQIRGEIAHAESVCSAGHDAEARALVSSSKRRHGYPG